ncbi:MAG: hypothetical protein PHF37_06000 [Phycisphaerae bacterium]|nr:hypothetical protein [Phycisphaerae bacterium]
MAFIGICFTSVIIGKQGFFNCFVIGLGHTINNLGYAVEYLAETILLWYNLTKWPILDKITAGAEAAQRKLIVGETIHNLTSFFYDTDLHG